MLNETLAMKRKESSNIFRAFCMIDTMLYVHFHHHRYLYANVVRFNYHLTPHLCEQKKPENCPVSWPRAGLVVELGFGSRSKVCVVHYVASAIVMTLLTTINSTLSVRSTKFQSGKSFFQ